MIQSNGNNFCPRQRAAGSSGVRQAGWTGGRLETIAGRRVPAPRVGCTALNGAPALQASWLATTRKDHWQRRPGTRKAAACPSAARVINAQAAARQLPHLRAANGICKPRLAAQLPCRHSSRLESQAATSSGNSPAQLAGENWSAGRPRRRRRRLKLEQRALRTPARASDEAGKSLGGGSGGARRMGRPADWLAATLGRWRLAACERPLSIGATM